MSDEGVPPVDVPAEDPPVVKSEQSERKSWKKSVAGLGPVLLLLLSKGKLLLAGLGKMSTLLSMLATIGVYWALYGWAFGVGLVLSIYIHEMGHVIALRHRGIAAGAPMFIPFVGAFIRLRQLVLSPVADNRIGLAGPLYGLGAAVFALASFGLTGAPAWAAIARTGAYINLFNLIPVWQLDGGRGFHSLDRTQRLLILAVSGALWFAAGETILLFIALGAAFRAFNRDTPAEGDTKGFYYYAALLVALTSVSVLTSVVRHAAVGNAIAIR